MNSPWPRAIPPRTCIGPWRRSTTRMANPSAHSALAGHSWRVGPRTSAGSSHSATATWRWAVPQEARTVYQQLVAGGQEALLGRLGDAQLTSGAIDEAVQSYERLLTLRPDSSRVRYQLARAYAAGGRMEDAERTYRQLLDSPTYGVQARVEAAALLRHNGKLAAAEPLLSQVLTLVPDHREGLLRLGEVLLGQGRPGEALPHWERLAELEPHNWRIQGHLSKAYSQLGTRCRGARRRDALSARKAAHPTSGESRG